MTSPDTKRFVEHVQETGVRFVRFIYCGNDGIIRGKAVATDFLEEFVEGGVGLTVAMQSFTVLDDLIPNGQFGPVGEVRLVPDVETFHPLPHSPRNGRLICDLYGLDREPWAVCPRSFLRRQIERLKAKGLSLRAAFENEFYLAEEAEDAFVPYDQSPCFSTIGMDGADVVIHDIAEALTEQGVHPEKYFAELGPGQQEMPVRHADALGAADNQLVFRDTVRAVAENHGLRASFAPKPFPEEAGNGCHVHMSLWDAAGEKSAHWDADAEGGLSKTARAFAGGILKHMQGLCALTAPTVNSYRRLQPRTWASAFACWGPDNREAALRAVSTLWGREAESINFEYKPADPSCNPYLALGGLIAAGLDGIETEADPGEPIDVDPATLTDDELGKRGIARLPRTLGEACDALADDEVLTSALGGPLASELLAVKRAEVETFRGRDLDFEVSHHFYKF